MTTFQETGVLPVLITAGHAWGDQIARQLDAFDKDNGWKLNSWRKIFLDIPSIYLKFSLPKSIQCKLIFLQSGIPLG